MGDGEPRAVLRPRCFEGEPRAKDRVGIGQRFVFQQHEPVMNIPVLALDPVMKQHEAFVRRRAQLRAWKSRVLRRGQFRVQALRRSDTPATRRKKLIEIQPVQIEPQIRRWRPQVDFLHGNPRDRTSDPDMPDPPTGIIGGLVRGC
jgi:hypothetical protein